MVSKIDYSKICFVMMPFGIKQITIPQTTNIFGITITKEKRKKIDFDFIYDNVFVPAISSVDLPEGGKLIPRRADREFYSGNISKTMFEFIEYSRMALTDITGLNANVFYELGVRHNSNYSGTTIFRLSDSIIPFDINQMRVFPYKYNPFDEIEKSKQLITSILEESIKYNCIDSPIYLALQRQLENFDIQALLFEAENELRNNNKENVLKIYDDILSKDKSNIVVRMKKGIMCKEMGRWEKALTEFDYVTKIIPSYPEAYKEKGIAENKLHETNKSKYHIDGVNSLQKAISLHNNDYDSYCSLGGIFKRNGEFDKSLKMYEKAIDLSLGNPYPLLNYIKLKANIENNFNISKDILTRINISKEYLENQVRGEIPYNAPWSFFDLSEIYSILGLDFSEIKKIIMIGINYCTHDWQIETFKSSLILLDKVSGVPENYKKSIELVNFLLETIITN